MNSKDFSANVRNYLDEVSAIVAKTDENAIAAVAEILLAAHKNGNTVFTAGNGGSSATASHMVNDLTKGCAVLGRNGFKAICLSDSSALVTCLANDFCYEDAYKIQLRTLGAKGDVLCVFTGSGNSENIVRACEYARENGITVVGFLGRDGGKTLPLCDAAVVAPCDCMEQIEDIHMVTEHALATVLRERLKDEWGLEVIFPPKGHNFKFALFDFDGTVCENKFPEIGAPKQDIIDALKREQLNGAILILWTCRSDKDLEAAEDWLHDQKLYPDKVNENADSTIEEFGSDPRKVYADEYWDDKNKDISTIDELSNFTTTIGAALRGGAVR